MPWLPCWKTGTSDLSSKFCSKVLARSQFEATYIYIYSQLAITSSTEQLHLTVSALGLQSGEAASAHANLEAEDSKNTASLHGFTDSPSDFSVPDDVLLPFQV